jgi:hypothetical protein
VAVADSLVRITGMVVLAVLMLVTVLMPTAVLPLAWDGPDTREPAITARGKMHQASTTHADMVHLRTMVLLPSWGLGAGVI